MRLTAILITAASFFLALPAAAETYYLTDHPGWRAYGSPNAKLTFTRADRSITDISIITYPADKAAIASAEEARFKIDEIVAGVVTSYSAACSGLEAIEPMPNGMGYEIVGDQNEPPCRLFISLTPDKRMFANLWVDNSDFPRDSIAYQKTAALWLDLAVSRIQGDPIVPTMGEPADLKAIAERIARDHSPLEMLLMQQTKFPPSQAALPVYEGEPLSNCLNWDPSAYAPRDLRFGGASGHALFAFGECSIFAWKRPRDDEEIEVFVEGEWRSLQSFGQSIFDDEINGARIEPFEAGETINFLGGDKKRLFDQHRGGSLRDLRAEDAWFTPDGRYTAGGFGLENKPVELPAQSQGRYYLHGHIAVFERDDGPILVALAGKIMNGSEIARIFIGGESYELSEEFRQLFNR